MYTKLGHEFHPPTLLARKTRMPCEPATGDWCGFSSTLEGNDLTIDQEKAKLELIVDIAHEVWGSI